MQTAHQEVERLLAKIRVRVNDPVIERASDQISVLCRGYMQPANPAELPGVHFSPLEQRIFNALYARLGKTVSRQAIFDAMYFDRGGQEPVSKMADVLMVRIRDRLEKADAPFWIETDWGNGWRLNPEKLPARNRHLNGRNKYVSEAAAA